MEFPEEPIPEIIKQDPIQIVLIEQIDQERLIDHPEVAIRIPGPQIIPEAPVQLEDLLQPEVLVQLEVRVIPVGVQVLPDHLQEEILPEEEETKKGLKAI